MNRLEIFQEVYGKDYVFTETELSRLQQVAELIVRECSNWINDNVGHVDEYAREDLKSTSELSDDHS